MPLLTKSSKGHLSQQKYGFKIPYADHKNKIKDIIDNKLNEPETKKAYHAFIDKLSQEKYENKLSSNKLNEPETKKTYHAFIDKLSQEKYENKLSSPKEIRRETSENKENPPKKISKTLKKVKKNEFESYHENKKRKLSFDTESSISQDDLNKGEIKAAFVEFMNNSLAEEENKKKGVIVYSSSEDLFDDIVDRFRNSSAKSDPKEKITKNKSYKKKLCAMIKPKDRKFQNKQTEESVSLKGKGTKKKNKKETEKKSHKKKIRKLSQQQIVESMSDSDEFPGLTDEEKINKIYERRNVGLYVLCDKCNKARYLPHIVDPLDLPETWYCHMNPDKEHNKCLDPEHVEEDSDFLIDNLYNAGSIVFVKMDGYPWWPAMVEDDVDTETYFWLESNSMAPTFYHVTFFDSAEVTRAWIRTEKIEPFIKNLKNPQFQLLPKNRYKSRMNVAVKQALDAADMPLLDRLKTYGFLKRFKKAANRNKYTKNKEKSNKRCRELSPLIEDDMSGILDNINMSDLSFNFLD